jgi:hypothetical protein
VQIDINPVSEEGWKFVEESLVSLCKNGGAKLIRLDAFGYVTKAAGTGCFMEVIGGCWLRLCDAVTDSPRVCTSSCGAGCQAAA